MAENQNDKIKECLAYFSARPVYRQIFRKMKDKYAGLGYLGGKITLTNLSAEDKIQLGGFFQKDYSENKSVTISVSFMKKTLSESRFSEVGLEELLTAYFQVPLTVNKEVRRQEEEKRESFFQEILQNYGSGIGGSWLQKVLSERGEGYQILMQQYKENSCMLSETLQKVLEGIELLPGLKRRDGGVKRELLAVFAARTTGNPHYYDEGMTGEKLLMAFLKEHFQEEYGEEESRVEKKNRLLYEAGLLKDDLSNDTLVYGIHARSSDGMLHEGIEGFLKRKEPLKLTLLTIGNLQQVWLQSEYHIVYMVENPAVFSMLVQAYPDCAVICGNGQPRLATLILMDLLKENNIFYYAGDFDPEGLLIAQRLRRRYGEKLRLWNYKTEWYEKCLSEVELSEARLKKLEKIELEELRELKEKMYQKKRAAYQEAMLECYAI